MFPCRVMVLGHGSIKEFDSPQALLADSNSIFYSMVKDANLEGWKAILLLFKSAPLFRNLADNLLLVWCILIFTIKDGFNNSNYIFNGNWIPMFAFCFMLVFVKCRSVRCILHEVSTCSPSRGLPKTTLLWVLLFGNNRSISLSFRNQSHSTVSQLRKQYIVDD